MILETLGRRPLLDLDLRLGEGTGAALAMGLIKAAVRVRDEMATFESAAISGPTAGDGPDQARPDVAGIILVRHAPTAWTGSRYCGRSDPPLDAAGVAAARRLAGDLATTLAPGTRIVTSPLRRAHATATAIADAAGIDDITIDDRWREADFGIAEGLTFEELERLAPDLARRLADGETEIDWPDGERAADLADAGRRRVARPRRAPATTCSSSRTRVRSGSRSALRAGGRPERWTCPARCRDPAAATVRLTPLGLRRPIPDLLVPAAGAFKAAARRARRPPRPDRPPRPPSSGRRRSRA